MEKQEEIQASINSLDDKTNTSLQEYKDKSDEIIKGWIPKFTEKGMKVQYSQNPTENGI